MRGRVGRAFGRLVVVLCTACAAPDGKRELRPGEAERAAGQLEFEAVLKGFGALSTLAGAGLLGDDTNDWDPSFEGGLAVSAELSTPHNALGDASGNTYIADKDAHAIRKVDPDGKITTVAGVNEAGDDGDEPGPGTERHLAQPNGLWVRSDGTVYILDLANRKVRRLGTDGELTTLFAAPDLTTGRGLWVSADEKLAYLCSGQEVLRFRESLGVDVFQGGFADLGNLFVDTDGSLTVTDRGAHRVYRVFADGQRELLAGDGSATRPVEGALALETGLNGVRGVWRHASGGWLFATHLGSQVLYMDSHGYVHVLIHGLRGAHAGDGEALDSPGAKVSEVRSVTLNPAGDLLVTEHDFGFVRVSRKIPEL